MLGVATSSPSPPTLKDNGQLLLELQGFAIGDSLTDLLQLSRLRKIPDLFPELATDSFIYANLCYLQFENFTEKVDPLPGAVPSCAEWIGYTTPSPWERVGKPFRSGNWFESLNVQVSVKCLSALLLPAACVIFKRYAFSSLGGLALSERRPY